MDYTIVLLNIGLVYLLLFLEVKKKYNNIYMVKHFFISLIQYAQ